MATLIIGQSSSFCLECGESASPSQRGHFTMLGYGPTNGQPGCGRIWTGMAADNPLIPDEILRDLRPDLPIVDYRSPFVAPEMYDD
jgi:hypothetical protein